VKDEELTDERSAQGFGEGQQADGDAISRAAAHIARALYEMQTLDDARNAPVRDEVARSSAVLEQLAGRIEASLAEDKEQRHVMAGQLSQLAGSLDSLVNHLQGLSHLMADILERLAEPMPAPEEESAPEPPSEPTFSPGGEGVTLTVANVPSFAALPEIQRALLAIDQVTSASVERFSEDEARLVLQLSASITASEIGDALHRSTTHRFVIEEARPELLRLKLKIVPA
jgi:hypothetical protein